MAGDVIPFELPSGVLDAFKGIAPTNDLSAGVQPSFGIVSFKGKVWRVKYKGEEHIIKNADGDPAASLIAVMVKGSPCISKLYYPGTYAEGDDAPPACFSIDGVRPDPGADDPQAQTCAACPHNVWGSKITEQGNKTKACSDSRRVAIVPYPDVANKAFGGPLLLRIPPASLQNLAAYNDMLVSKGVPYQAVVVKIGFDASKAYPHLTFTPMAAVDADKASVIMEMVESPEVERMLASAPITDEADTPAQAARRAAGPKPAPAPAPASTKAPEQAPAAVTAGFGQAISETPEDRKPAEEVTPSDPAPEKEAEKPSAKEQNSVEGDRVSGDISELINSFGL